MTYSQRPLFVFMVDTVGEHRGMHYYNFPLVSALNQYGMTTILLSTPETASSDLRPSNVPVRGVFRGIYGNRPKWWRGMLYSIALTRVFWWCLWERPDIVHFHFFQVPLLDFFLLAGINLLGIKTIATVHDVLPFELGKDLAHAGGRKIYDRLYSASSGLILHTRQALRVLNQFNASLSPKTALIPHGNYVKVHSVIARSMIPKDDAKSRLGIDGTACTMLVFGTIKQNKRLDLVLAALARVTHKHPEAKLLVVGEPQDRDVVEDIALAEELGVASNVVWRLQRVTDEELAIWFSAADMMIFPYAWIYQSGALIMSMNFSKPVIATNIEGNDEIVTHKSTGLLVSLGDVGDMAQAITYIIENPDRASAMGKAACEFVTKELAWDNIALSTIDFYRQCFS